MLRGPLSLLALTAGIYLTGSIIWGAAGLAAIWAVLLAAYDVPSGWWLRRTWRADGDPAPGCPVRPQDLGPCWEWSVLGRLAWLALPLGIAMMLFALNTNIPRYFIKAYLGERELGVFAAMAYLMMAGHQVVVGALAQAVRPRLARYYAAGNIGAFRRLLLKLVGIGAALGAVGVLAAWVAGRQILSLVYKPEYAEHPGVFTVLMAAAGVLYVSAMFESAAVAARRLRTQTVVLAAVTLVSLLCCALLIRDQHLAGAAAAVAVSSVVGLAAYGGILLTTIKPPGVR